MLSRCPRSEGMLSVIFTPLGIFTLQPRELSATGRDRQRACPRPPIPPLGGSVKIFVCRFMDGLSAKVPSAGAAGNHLMMA